MIESRVIGLLLAFVIGVISGGAISDRIYGPEISYLIKREVSIEKEIKSCQTQNMAFIEAIRLQDKNDKAIRAALNELGLGDGLWMGEGE